MNKDKPKTYRTWRGKLKVGCIADKKRNAFWQQSSRGPASEVRSVSVEEWVKITRDSSKK